jgi:hypothetical protein
MKENGRWISTTAGLGLINEIDGTEAIDSYRDVARLAELAEEEVHTYTDKQEAIRAGRKLARHHVPSRLIVHGEDGAVEETTSFEVFTRQHHQIVVSGTQDLDVAESVYLR